MTKKASTPALRFKGFTYTWKQRKLGECFTERVESMPEGELISVTINDGIKKFSELGRHDNSNDDKSKYKKVCIGDIAYNSMRMWQGASGYSPYEGIVSPAYTVLSPNERIYSKCIAYQFKLPEMIHTFQINSQGITSDNWNLKYPTFSEIEIYVSKDMKEQELIAKYFTLLDRLITLHQRKYDKLTNMKKSMLEKMFPKNGANVPEIRFKGFTDAWEQRKVGDFYDFKNGLNKGKEFFGAGTPIVNFTDVFHNRGLCAKKLKGRVTIEPTEVKNYEVKQGDIFFTRTSETIEEIGYPSVMLDTAENTVFSGFVLRGRCYQSEDPLDDLFKKYVFFTDTFRVEMLKKSSMTTRALTSGTAIRNMVFQFPKHKEEQRKIAKYLTALDRLITLHQRELEKLKNLKKACLEKMFV